MLQITYFRLAEATFETCYVVFFACAIATIIGLPLAIILYLYRPGGLKSQCTVYQFLASIVNGMRSIPFVILMVMLLPLTRLIVGTSIGPVASIVPASIAAIPFVAKMFQNIFDEIPQGLIESGLALGASPRQIIWRMVLPEALPGLVNAITVTAVTLVGYVVMAGAIIGGGLGELAINYGYQRYDIKIMLITVILLILLVQCLQMIGDAIARRLQHV